jgi:low temperature requirement protein LtrA
MDEAGKRVSWVELYLDLVFVLAVGRLAHLIVGEPEMHSVWVALGLFVTLWWTWVGFAVLYNRRGADTTGQRLLFLAGSVPVGLAAVAIEPASTGDVTAFALSLAATRVLLALAHVRGTEALDRRILRACVVSAILFAASPWLPGALTYIAWAIAIGTESGAMLAEDKEARRRLRRDHDLAALAPQNPAEALDAHHFAERFGLFLIILIGEVIVEAAQGSGDVATTAGWGSLIAAMVLAGALWWLYFDSAADINLTVLRLTGGSPTMARAIFAVGHMLPAFALLITAAGVGLLLEPDPPRIAAWLACVGIGMYLAGTRAFLIGDNRVPRIVRVAILIATFQLARLRPELSAHAYLWLLAAWVAVCAALTTSTDDREAALARYLGGRRDPV